MNIFSPPTVLSYIAEKTGCFIIVYGEESYTYSVVRGLIGGLAGDSPLAAGTLADMNAKQENGYLIFENTRFSFYTASFSTNWIFAAFGDIIDIRKKFSFQ